jgi:hypothetical protein
MKSIEVKAKTRALRSTWTREMAIDINQFSGIDNSSFESYLIKEIRKEKRKKSINKIFQN